MRARYCQPADTPPCEMQLTPLKSATYIPLFLMQLTLKFHHFLIKHVTIRQVKIMNSGRKSLMIKLQSLRQTSLQTIIYNPQRAGHVHDHSPGLSSFKQFRVINHCFIPIKHQRIGLPHLFSNFLWPHIFIDQHSHFIMQVDNKVTIFDLTRLVIKLNLTISSTIF